MLKNVLQDYNIKMKINYGLKINKSISKNIINNFCLINQTIYEDYGKVNGIPDLKLLK
jgi:hypothetical protein